MSMTEFCKQHDIAMSTFSKWHSKFNSKAAPEKRAFKQIETPSASVKPAPASQGSVISLQIGHDIVLTIRSGEPVL
jgi:hypothetical protein